MALNSYLLAIDQGTTGTTVALFCVTQKGIELIAKANTEYTQHFPAISHVEHDLNEIWASFVSSCKQVLSAAEAKDASFNRKMISAIGITNQRETVAIYDRKDLTPKGRAIVWQDKRSTAICKAMKEENLEAMIRDKTGLLLDPYFTGTKIKWLTKKDPSLSQALASGKWVLSTIDSYMLARLSAGEGIFTEASNASRTLLMNIKTRSWDQDLIELFGLKNKSSLPEIKDSVGLFAKTKGLGFLPDNIPITAMLGDQQAALAGQNCFSAGEAKCTYGTGSFLLIQNGSTLKYSQKGMLTTVAWQLAGKVSYALEGSAFIAGASVQFLRDQLKLIQNASESETLAANEKAAPNIYFIPALSGLGAPYWNPNAKGAFLGLTRDTSKGQLLRAALEAMAFQVYDLVRTAEDETQNPLKVLRVDGGAVANNLLLQIQADLLAKPVERPEIIGTTSYGVALFAGLGAGLFSSLEELGKLGKTDRVFVPSQKASDKENRETMIRGWQRGIQAVELFASAF